MSTYSWVFLISNVIAPIVLMSWKSVRDYGNNIQQRFSNLGKWALLIVAMALFNTLRLFIRKNYDIMFIGLLIKVFIILMPRILNNTVEQWISNLHLHTYIDQLKANLINWYFKVTWLINVRILHSQVDDAQRNLILEEIKDIVSKIELDHQDGGLKNKAFSVQKKLMLKAQKKYASFGVNCDIISMTELNTNRELLKVLSSGRGSSSDKQLLLESEGKFSTKDRKSGQTVSRKTPSVLVAGRGMSDISERQSVLGTISQQQSPHTENSKSNPQRQDALQSQKVFVKQSSSEMVNQIQEDNSPNRKPSQEPYSISINSMKGFSPKKNQTNTSRHPNTESHFQPRAETERAAYPSPTSSMFTQNINNQGMIDSQSGISYATHAEGNDQQLLNFSVKQSAEESLSASKRKGPNKKISRVIQEESEAPSIIPGDVSSISGIQMRKSSHPFKFDASNISNPLVIDNSKILPASLYNSSSINPAGKKALSSQSFNPPALSNLQNVNTESLAEKFSEQSSIPHRNSLQQSISQSEYSDMFESQGEQDLQPQVEIKVEAIVENPRSQKGLKPRLDICNIELFTNDEIKFLSLYDKCTFYGRLISMAKLPNNYYDMKTIQYDLLEGSKDLLKTKEEKREEQSEQKQVIKKVKFRGQAKPFMRFLQKS